MGRPISDLIEPLRRRALPDGASAWGSLLGAALLVFVTAQATLNTLNGYWIDEYFSTWISDPARSFGPEFFGVVTRDTNPPIYFTALRLMRGLVAEPRMAYLMLDAVFLIATAGFVAWAALRTETPRLGAAAFAAFLLSGPVMMQFPEGRTYFLAICTAMCGAWAGGLVLIRGGSRPLYIALGAIGAIAALSHVFAALFAGSLALGLMTQAALSRRRDLMFAALALGGVASLVFVVWFKTAAFTLNAVSWIEFSATRVSEAFWTVRRLTLGPPMMMLPFLALAGYGAWRASSRPIVVVFGVAIAAFLLLPIAISFKTPILTGRYWTVGGPAVVIMLVLLARDFLLDGGRWPRLAAAASIGVLLLSALFGFVAARDSTQDKPQYAGAPLVAKLARDCGPGAINAASIVMPPFAMTNFMAGFPLASGLPADRFVDVNLPGTQTRIVSPEDCAVVGWQEHLLDDEAMAGPDAPLLDRLRLSGPPGLLKVVRYRRSVVVVNTAKADPAALP